MRNKDLKRILKKLNIIKKEIKNKGILQYINLIEKNLNKESYFYLREPTNTLIELNKNRNKYWFI